MLELIPASAIIAIVVIALIVIFLAVGYVKAPPDMAFIISGIKKKSKIVIGKAAIRIPFFERLDKLNLRLIPIDVKTSNAVPTADYININVDATVNVKISNDHNVRNSIRNSYTDLGRIRHLNSGHTDTSI